MEERKKDCFSSAAPSKKDSPSICPKCGEFTLAFKQGYGTEKDAYVCSNCGTRVPVSEHRVSLNENTLHRFPGNEGAPRCPLDDFLKSKK